MSRKILKILISLLFLAVSAVAAIFAIKNFGLLDYVRTKYGIGDPVFIEDENTTKYGVAYADPFIKSDTAKIDTTGYGTSIDIKRPENNITKASVSTTTRYGVFPVSRSGQDNK